jgi:hypothetical protein
MILTRLKPGKTKFVYIGRKDGKIQYIGRGNLSRAVLLIEGNHHIKAEFDEVEVLGPMSFDESVHLERDMIFEYVPPLNDTFNREKHPLNGYIPTGIPRGRPKGPEEKTQLIIEDIMAKDMSQSEIARKYNVSRQFIHRVKKRHVEQAYY